MDLVDHARASTSSTSMMFPQLHIIEQLAKVVRKTCLKLVGAGSKVNGSFWSGSIPVFHSLMPLEVA